jgi:hypothetical protein
VVLVDEERDRALPTSPPFTSFMTCAVHIAGLGSGPHSQSAASGYR